MHEMGSTTTTMNGLVEWIANLVLGALLLLAQTLESLRPPLPRPRNH